MKRKTLFSVIILSFAVLTFGCDQREKKTDTSSSSVATTSAEATEKPVQNSAVTLDSEAPTEEETILQKVSDDFMFGVAINTYQLKNEELLGLIKKEFNSITMENQMKPEAVLDWKGSERSKNGDPAINTELLDEVLTLAKDNGLKLRAHTLVWHSQTPDWFFRQDYDTSKEYVNKKTMLERMESYIKQVIEYCQTNYSGVVYAWDVVNEAIADDGGYRSERNNWYKVIGEEYVEKAFEYANKYADNDVKLFYNDYNCYLDSKREDILNLILKPLWEKKYLDGMGMQSHWGLDFPNTMMVKNTITFYSQLKGIELQLTEIDVHNPDNTDAGNKKLAEYYKDMFSTIIELDRNKSANITSVTFWGLSDDVSWLSGFKGETSYPLLFNENHQRKLCYDEIYKLANK